MTNSKPSIAALQSRYDRLKMNGKNIDSPGVLRKLRRKIRNAQKEQ